MFPSLDSGIGSMPFLPFHLGDVRDHPVPKPKKKAVKKAVKKAPDKKAPAKKK
jgi:hypothetical protein